MKIKIFRKKDKSLKIVVTLKDLEPSMIEVLENRVTGKIANKIVGEKYDEVSKKVLTEDKEYLRGTSRWSCWRNVCPNCQSNVSVRVIGASSIGGESICQSCKKRWIWSDDGPYDYL